MTARRARRGQGYPQVHRLLTTGHQIAMTVADIFSPNFHVEALATTGDAWMEFHGLLTHP